MLVDGNLSDWATSDRIDNGLTAGYAVYAKPDGNSFVFALSAPTAISTNSTAWLNTDRNANTGFQIFGFAGGAEFNVNVNADGTVSLYSGDAGANLIRGGIEASWSADKTILEFRVAKSDLGNPTAIDTLYDINNTTFLPSSFSAKPFTVFDNTGIAQASDTRIAIVFSETTERNYFSETAYSQLFMAAQAQATQAGLPFDILKESDLTNLATLSKYDTIVFPSFRNVDSSQLLSITNTLEQATKQFGIGLVAAGEFMTNDQNNNALPGDSYARMKLLFDATRVAGGTGDVSLVANDLSGKILDGYANGEIIHNYANVGWNAFTSVSGSGQALVKELVGDQSYTAMLATQTGGRNVLFSSPAVMADANLLQKAIDYSVNGSSLSVSLNMTRMSGLTATRVDMDQSQEMFEVKPEAGPGVYDKLIPILQNWKDSYNFVGSYYLNVGADAANGQGTNWAISLPYYKAILATGSELGSHSYTHPADTNLLSDSQIAFEFGTAKTVLEQNLSNYLGKPFVITGAAVPGNPESIAVSQKIQTFYKYLTGGYSGVGAGYPNAFGALTPADAASGKTYLAPNIMSDFTLVEFQKKTVAEASAAWTQQYNDVVSHAESPVVLWTWHDYGAAAWNSDGPSPYTTQMFTDFIAMNAKANMEFVTLDDLTKRMSSFQSVKLTTTVNGSTINATVSAAQPVGTFALDLENISLNQQIKNVTGWYAYDANSVFLPISGGTFSINVGSSADDVTHITSLPARANLVSLAGDGRNLNFTIDGEGKVIVDVQAAGNNWVSVTGATVVSRNGEIYTLDIGATGLHSVTVGYTTNVAPIISSLGGGDSAKISMAENLTAVATVKASDNNAALGDSVSYQISSAGDGSFFTIDANTGVLTFKTAPDFETPQDLNKDNIYDVTVIAKDALGMTDTQLLAVSVTNVVGVNKIGSFLNDTMNGTSEEDILNGFWGNDTLNGLAGNDILYGDLGNDKLFGGAGADRLYGDSGDDQLDGGEGNDLIVGGSGKDTMIGGNGSDVFVFNVASESSTLATSRDVIRDFQSGIDKIDLSAIDANLNLSGNQAFSFLSSPTTSFTSSGQVHYFYQTVSGIEYTVVEGKTSGLGAAFAIALQGHLNLSSTDFVL